MYEPRKADQAVYRLKMHDKAACFRLNWQIDEIEYLAGSA
jgi:hypothetical protein